MFSLVRNGGMGEIRVGFQSGLQYSNLILIRDLFSYSITSLDLSKNTHLMGTNNRVMFGRFHPHFNPFNLNPISDFHVNNGVQWY